MVTKRSKPARRLRYPLNRIKRDFTYEPVEIAKLFGIHRNTVGHWLMAGLQPIDSRRPVLVHGSALKSFLVERQGERRRTCAVDEWFCFRCREARKAWGGMADLTIRSESIGDLGALCATCEGVMHRAIRRADLPKIAQLLEIRPPASGTLNDWPEASVICASSEAA